MIPFRDHNQTTTTPIMTPILIAVNVLVFLYMMTLGDMELERFAVSYAVIPSDIIRGVSLATLVTSLFLHAGIGHIVGNMLFLHIFGDNLEDMLGRIRYLFYYLISGIGASILQIATNPSSDIPNIGASGAIAGLMGGYLLLFPKNRIDVLIPFGLFMSRATVPAYTMLFYWFLVQFLTGAGSLGIGNEGGIAYFAHVGGFLTGIVLLVPFKKSLQRSHNQPPM